ncbi:hypothetical protein FA95DRAFT_183472 [Auriscalpium vulgare]|uniref:Uncharacterized protein n=1 Tax=Auriscalpium vulgare TaxID=40419 RepID=A0ACB8RMT3_9AGAM|nr:hypothetical protein FA95DRAFT_183472 [Auriscalpium vulgare]
MHLTTALNGVVSTIGVASPVPASTYWSSALSSRLTSITSLSDIYNNSPTNPALTAFDDEALALLHTLQSLRSHRNAHTPISRLPPELLAQIFSLCADADRIAADYVDEHDTPESHASSLMAITHVCHAWRALALDCPFLWSFVDFTLGEARASEIVRRARSAPLAFFGGIMGSGTDAVRLIVENKARIASLRLRAHGRVFGALFKGLGGDMPTLERLELTEDDEDDHGQRDVAQPDSDTPDAPDAVGGVPAQVAALHMPRLRHLTLVSETALDWSALQLPALESLAVKLQQSAPFQPPPSLGTVLSALEGMPGLKTLSISNDLPAAPSHSLLPSTPWVGPERPVALPHLEQLELGGGLVACAHLLTHIVAPQGVTLKMNVDCELVLAGEYSTYFEGVRAWMGRADARGALDENGDAGFAPVDAAVTSVAATTHTPNMVVVSVTRNYHSSLPAVELALSWGCGAGSTRAAQKQALVITQAACALFAGAQLARIGMDSPAWTHRAWAALFARSPGLHTVIAHGYAGVALCVALHELDEARGAGVALPGLASVVLNDVTEVDKGVPLWDDLPFAQAFPAWLADRAAKGYPVGDVVIDAARSRKGSA